MVKRDWQRLEFIRDKCLQIQHTLSRIDTSLDTFLADYIYPDSISFNLYCIGDTASRLRADYRAATGAAVPWDALISLADDILHRFDDVDLRVVWRTATEDIPALCHFCNQQLAQETE